MGGIALLAGAASALVSVGSIGCAARGHIATPDELTRLQQTAGWSASGKIAIAGPKGRFSARVVFGVARPDSLRIEIPAGAELRFLLVCRNGSLRADFPADDAMYEGPATPEVMNRLFGIELDPADLVGAMLGAPSPASVRTRWRFERAAPAIFTLEGPNQTRLTLTLHEADLTVPSERAFEFAGPRSRIWTLAEMADRLGLRR